MWKIQLTIHYPKFYLSAQVDLKLVAKKGEPNNSQRKFLSKFILKVNHINKLPDAKDWHPTK